MTFKTEFGSIDKPIACTCTMYRKDRAHKIEVTEYYRECRRDTGPWTTHPARMLRHKAMIQCARVAFGFVGIYDEDEAERIIDGTHTVTHDAAIDELNAAVVKPDDPPTTLAGTAAQMMRESAPPLELTGEPSISDVLSMLQKAKTPDAIAEDRRLMYVAVTRAKRYLHLSYHGITINQYGTREATRSRFLTEMKLL